MHFVIKYSCNMKNSYKLSEKGNPDLYTKQNQKLDNKHFWIFGIS